MTNRRIALAFVVAPLVPIFYFLVLVGFSNKYAVAMTLMYSIFFSYVPTLIFGIPMLSYLRKKNRLSLMSVVVIGTLMGVVVFVAFKFVFASMLSSSESFVLVMSDLIWGAILGVSVALPFSFIAGIPLSTERNKRSRKVSDKNF